MNELTQCRKTNPYVTRSSDNIEWYTPAQHIEAARGVMGGIVLDPASCEAVNKVVNAARIYTIQNDSRSQPWASQVWFDPAYARQLSLQTGACNTGVKMAIVILRYRGKHLPT